MNSLERRIEMLEYHLKDKEKGFICRIEEQNGRLVQFIDERVERLDQHNEWIRKRLDSLEHFRNRVRHPIKSIKRD